MIGAAIEAAINVQEPQVGQRLRGQWIAGDWSFRPLGDHRYVVTIGGEEVLEITAGGPFAGMAELYQRGSN